MNKQFTVRKFHTDDLGNLMAVWEGANQLAHPFLCDSYVAQVRQDIPAIYLPNADTWVAETGNLVVGFISLIDNEIGALFVSPALHGAGIGTALVNKAGQLHGQLEVEVFQRNTIGFHFYSQFGFSILEESVQQETNQKVLRLRYVSGNQPRSNENVAQESGL